MVEPTEKLFEEASNAAVTEKPQLEKPQVEEISMAEPAEQLFEKSLDAVVAEKLSGEAPVELEKENSTAELEKPQVEETSVAEPVEQLSVEALDAVVTEKPKEEEPVELEKENGTADSSYKQEKSGAEENEGSEKVSLNVEDIINGKNEIPASDEKQTIQGDEQVKKMVDNESVIWSFAQ